MSNCTDNHQRMGIVTTHPDGYVKGEPHAAISCCNELNCIRSAKRWVKLNSGLPGVYREDPPDVRARAEEWFRRRSLS